LTHTNKAYSKSANSYRVAGEYDEINFGIVEIGWDVVPSPLIKLVAMNAAGEPYLKTLCHDRNDS